MWPFDRKREERASFTQSTPQSFRELVGLALPDEVSVTNESAMGIPSVWAAVNFISGTIAGLPLKVYRKTEGGREAVTSPLAMLLHDAVSAEMTSFEWRKYTMERVLTGGRGLTHITKNRAGRVSAFTPLDPRCVTVKRVEGRKVYHYKEGGFTAQYGADEIIDLPFTLKEDGIGHLGPIMTNKGVLTLAIGAERYAQRFFQGGGVPPFVVSGNFQSSGALSRAADDLEAAVKKAATEGRAALTLPDGLKIDRIGADPDKGQLLETQKFLVEQIARIYNLPPTFLQDLSHGTYSNTEQQDLHFVKHTLKRWVEQFEQELNLKLFRGSDMYAEFSVDGLLRGDFKTRFDGYAQAVQNAVMTPNEARRRENMPDKPNGDDLLIQGATVPLGQQPEQEPPNDP